MSADTAVPDAPARQSRRSRRVLLLVAAVLAAADLVIKAVAEALLSTGATTDLGPINIRLLYNRGVAFSLGADLAPWVVIAATGLIIAALIWYTVTTAPAMPGLSRAGAAMLLGGATGNFIDRLDGQGVVDYLHSGWFPTFNLADVFVTTGVALLVLGTMLSPRSRTGD
ncbi:signal peptidase II [Paenarthrobacter ureafaciens]|uniref:signal peptidase II n=1 Tax=Paenarthrobacter ureafaciens TaxID=37931 RepID=UPI001A99A426|nr:signal peptidase II [Paenarthrobacter ureafaciens]QSZ53670.1 lipoprotein signal peptidase [Paenarthrobacter ureafaciens]